MRIVRFIPPDGALQWGWVHEDKVGAIDGNIFGDYRRAEATIPRRKVRLMPPAVPSKIICVGRNYVAHAKELDNDVPEIPLLFLKPPSSLIGHEASIRLPGQSNRVDHEAELAVVIGQSGRWIRPDRAIDHVFGYTIANDVTARDLQKNDKTWTRGKGFDTFCPLGPWIETNFDPVDAVISCHVNGDLRQMASTRDMVFSIRHLISFASSIMTLDAGDVLLTGTPAGVAALNPGDIVEVNVQGLGTLRNSVKAERHGSQS
jgi:2-keto-4-pentenoate hydratase/2-oxohepta-3-ene-1,7-dioic acid hydratase in catechol pathway